MVNYILWIRTFINLPDLIILLIADNQHFVDAMLSANQDLRNLAMEGTLIFVQQIFLRLYIGITSISLYSEAASVFVEFFFVVYF